MRRAPIVPPGLLALSCSHRELTDSLSRNPPAQAVAAVSAIPELAPQAGEKVVARDVGGHGKPDLWVYSVLVAEDKERVVRRERDLNGDGKVDLWESYDADGNVAKQAY